MKELCSSKFLGRFIPRDYGRVLKDNPIVYSVVHLESVALREHFYLLSLSILNQNDISSL